MNKIRLKYLIFLFFLLFLNFVILSSINKDIKDIPIAKKGIIDLRNIDFNEQKIVKLDGEWEFYFNKSYN